MSADTSRQTRSPQLPITTQGSRQEKEAGYLRDTSLPSPNLQRGHADLAVI